MGYPGSSSYHTETGVSSLQVQYDVSYHYAAGKYLMQLGGGLFHEILEISVPSSPRLVSEEEVSTLRGFYALNNDSTMNK